MDGGDVSDLPAGPPRRFANPRLRCAEGICDHVSQEKNPQTEGTLKFGERWRPYRTVASWYMWRAVELAGSSARKITKNPKASRKRVVVKRTIVRRKRLL